MQRTITPVLTLRLVCLVLILIILTGCYGRLQEAVKVQDNLVPYNNNDTIAVMIPDDGKYTPEEGGNETKIYTGSGITTAHKIQAALLTIFDEVDIVNTKNQEKAKDSCKSKNIRLLAIPHILHWEDRNTPWSGLADRIEIKIDIFDIVQNATVNGLIFKAHNEWGTLTDKPPEDLLDDKFTTAVVGMFKSE